MTTATLTAGNRTMDTAVVRPRRSLEELVDQLMAAMFPARPAAVVVEATVAETETPTETAPQSVARSVHEARRLRQAGDVDGALAVLGGADMAEAESHEARWAFSEWKQLVKRRFGGRMTPWSTARERAGPPRWRPRATAGRLRSSRSWECAGEPGKLVSGRSLRGLRPLNGGA